MCVNARVAPVNFMENSTASCHVQLHRHAFDNCSSLRESLMSGLHGSVLNRVTHVSRLGAIAHPISLELIVSVLVEEQDAAFVKERQLLLDYANEEQQQMVLMYRTSARFTCALVPAHIGLDVFYAQTAHMGNKPVYEIVAVYR